jgi:hypothetical protein
MKKIGILLIILFAFANLVVAQESGLYKFLDDTNGKYGFMNETGKIIIKPQYIITSDFSEGLCYVSVETSARGYRWFFIDTLGNKVFDVGDNFVEKGFSQGYAVINGNNEEWFIDKKGNKAFGRTWGDIVTDFNEGIAKVSDVKFKGDYLIATDGSKIDNMPARSFIFQNGLAGFYDETGSGIIKRNGQVIISGLENCDGYLNDYIKVKKKDAKWGFIDKEGVTVLPFNYEKDDIEYANDSLFYIKENGAWGIAGLDGRYIVKPSFKNVHAFSEGLASVSKDGKSWGFIDKTGNFILPPAYYLADSFKNGICAVRKQYQKFETANDYYLDTIIDKNGIILNEVGMHCYMGFVGGLIEYYGGMHFTGGVHYLNKQGKMVVPH